MVCIILFILHILILIIRAIFSRIIIWVQSMIRLILFLVVFSSSRSASSLIWILLRSLLDVDLHLHLAFHLVCFFDFLIHFHQFRMIHWKQSYLSIFNSSSFPPASIIGSKNEN